MSHSFYFGDLRLRKLRWAPPPFDVIHPRAYEGIAQRRRKTNQKPDKA